MKTTSPERRLIRYKMRSDLSNVGHPNTLRQWDAKGILKAVSFGQRKDRRYRKEDIEKLINTKRR